MVLWGAGLLLIIAVMAAAAAWYVLGLPGKSYSGPLTPPTSAEQDLADRLRQHVTAIASVPHNVAH